MDLSQCPLECMIPIIIRIRMHTATREVQA